MGLFSFLDRVTSWLPIQSRIERWKNEIDKLEKERIILLKGECNDKKANRLLWIDNRLDELYRLCKNKVS